MIHHAYLPKKENFMTNAIFKALVFSMLLHTYADSAKISSEAVVDIVLFSYDRAPQYFALLESIKKYVQNIGTVTSVIRTTSKKMRDAYDVVHQIFPWAHPLYQGENPRVDFKPLTLQAIYSGNSPYFFFAVDDDIFFSEVCLGECASLIEQENAFGFYLRLGKNITESYNMRVYSGVPNLRLVTPRVWAWCFENGTGDWKYAGSVDATVWRKKDIRPFIENNDFCNPNQLENVIHPQTPHDGIGLCYTESKLVGLPMNLVNETDANRNMHAISPEALLQEFNRGKKLDITSLRYVKINAPHIEFVPPFIPR